jgi:hypothetical protein
MELNEIIKYAKLLETEKKHLNKVSINRARNMEYASRAKQTTLASKHETAQEYCWKIEKKLFEIMEQAIKDNIITFKYLEEVKK